MTTTPKAASRRNGARELIPLTPSRGISLNVNERMSGEELEKAIQGIVAFSKSFPAHERYELSLELVKITEDEPANEAR